MIRGVFTQKKKLWEAVGKLAGEMKGWHVLDDVAGKSYEATYANLCNRLRLIGRATVTNPEGMRVFLIVDAQMNSVRDWDVDEEGKPQPNPIKGEADEEKGE
jgi:hypothetical protein